MSNNTSSRRRLNTIATLFVSMVIGNLPLQVSAIEGDYTRPVMKVPQNNQITAERIALGKALFFDPRLSGKNKISCASCHDPAAGWSDGLAKAIGEGQKVLGRATPTILNTAYNRLQMWDGRALTLRHQSTGPIESVVEMNQSMPELLIELGKVPGYVEMFEKAYPGKGISKETIGMAISTFERTITSTEAPFDRWIAGDQNAINKSAQNGFKLFENKANCAACHHDFNFVDDGFHNIGLPETDDIGRYHIVRVNIAKGAFKTPTLRDVTLTAPYMHNGVYQTLEEVIDHYNKGGVAKDNLDPNMKELNLTKQEGKDLVAFLKTLTGEPRVFVPPVLPTNP